jgi:hypothetical protein
MDSNNLNVLVEAKKEYLTQLYIVMCPAMIEVFEDLYSEASKVAKGKKVLIQYQKFLKEVANWNDHMVHSNANRITSSCNWFNDLLAAVFVSSVKILSSVRLNADGSKISLKMPNNKVFIHGCFIAAAKDLYKNPYIYHDESIEQERDTELTKRFSKCIEDTVKDMLPVQEILKSCMAQSGLQDNIDIESTLGDEDTEDPDIIEDGEEEPEPEPEPAAEEPAAEEPSAEAAGGAAVAPEEAQETKSINVNNVKLPEMNNAEEDDGVLFPDASDEK